MCPSLKLTDDLVDLGSPCLESSIELAHILRVTALAEGVEDEEALDILRDLGCDYIQGYYLSKPLKDKEFISWCKSPSDDFNL